MRKIISKKTLPVVIILTGIILAVGVFLFFKSARPPQDTFDAPTRSWESPKKVEDYFVSSLRMTPEDLKHQEGRKEVSFYVTENSTIQGIIGNLTHYGFARTEDALKYALENTEDKNGNKVGAVQTGSTG